MKVKPLGNRIVVKQMSTEEVTASGIVLPANSEQEKPNQGTVVAVGNGELIERFGIKVGDVVVFNGYGIAEVEIDENGQKEKYKIVYLADDEDSQAVAVIEK